LTVAPLVQLDEILNGRRKVAQLQVAAAAQFLGNISEASIWRCIMDAGARAALRLMAGDRRI
jgi:hypothetical protein